MMPWHTQHRRLTFIHYPKMLSTVSSVDGRDVTALTNPSYAVRRGDIMAGCITCTMYQFTMHSNIIHVIVICMAFGTHC